MVILLQVSLAASERCVTNDLPLSSTSDECSRQFEFESVDETANDIGNYFAFARVFPSSKV